ncbi:MAG: ABC transporter ATP-binding protein [Planctomycetota bacterium]
MQQTQDPIPAPAGGHVVAEARYDLDDDLRFVRRHVRLLESDGVATLVFETDAGERQVVLADVDKADLDEAAGLDRLVLTLKSGENVGMPFSRQQSVKLGMTRLLRQIQRRLEGETGPDLAVPPDDGPDIEADLDKPRLGVLLRLLEVARPYQARLWISLGLTALVGVVMVLPQLITKFIFDQAIDPSTTRDLTGGERFYNLGFWATLFLLAVTAQMFIFWLRLRLLGSIGSRVAGDLRDRVYTHLHRLSMRYFGKHRTGSLITRVTSDTDRLWDFIVFGSVDYFRNVLMIVAATVIMLVVNWQLALIALAPVPFVAILTYYKSQKMTRLFGRLWTYWSRLTAVVGDTIPGVKVVKAFAAEGREVERFSTRNRDFTDDELATVNVWINLQPIVEGTMFLSRLLILVAGGLFIIYRPVDVSQSANTVGTLFMFLAILGMYQMAIMDMVQKQRLVTRAATSAQRVFEVLDTPVEIDSKPDALVPTGFEGHVEFRDVSFSYDCTKPVLRHIDLVAEPGQMIGLCGHSGAGKSTFVNLVSRFFDVSDGQILVDGVDLRDYDLEWLRSHVGVVLQEPYLFFGTVADNIRYGRPDATLAEVVQAARAANAHDFVSQLPDGYDTIVGERGQSLSGGERQRVSIARAILQNPKILVLDEATSSVDTKTEKAIQQALDRLVTGRTTFAIAHRLSTLASADQIVVLDKGRIVEQGDHDGLLQKPDGRFRKLVDMQQQLQANAFEETEA